MIDIVGYSVNLKALRMLRVIRPLKTLKAVPSMKRQVTTLLKSLPELANSGIFVIFISALIAILGLQQFTGIQYFRCRTMPQPINHYWPKSTMADRVCTSPNSTSKG